MKNLIKILPIVIILFFVILMSYAVISKISDFRNFKSQLAQSPGIEEFGRTIAYGIIVLQTVAVVLLCHRPFRLWGLWMNFGILCSFVGYIGIILIYSNNLPCTCLGLFEKMTWKGNLVLNIGLMITALTGIMTMKAGRSK